jgi:hypothetical protein
VETFNKFLVGVRGDDIVVLKENLRLSKADALNLAAHLVALADDNDEFQALYQAVCGT